jgi:hypothetical protein
MWPFRNGIRKPGRAASCPGRDGAGALVFDGKREMAATPLMYRARKGRTRLRGGRRRRRTTSAGRARDDRQGGGVISNDAPLGHESGSEAPPAYIRAPAPPGTGRPAG